jgi:hypothetical protein
MADKDDTTSTHSGRNQTDEHVPARTPSPPNGNRPRSLQQAIEAERSQLLRAHAVVHCLYEVLLHAEAPTLSTTLKPHTSHRTSSTNLSRGWTP